MTLATPNLRAPRLTEHTWYCRFLAPESAWHADSIVRTGSPRSPGEAALEFCRSRGADLQVPRTKHAIVECQGTSTLYHVHLAWTREGIQVERVDRIG